MEKQLLYELAAAERLPEHISWDVVVFCCDADSGRKCFIHKMAFGKWSKVGRVITLLSSFLWLFKKAHNYDVIMVRYSKLLFLLSFSKRIKRKLVTVHHTKEYDEERLRVSPRDNFSSFFDNYITKKLTGVLAGVVGVTQEIAEFAAKRFNISQDRMFIYPNGVDFQQVQLVGDKRAGVVKFVMMASEYHLWHGLEFIIDAFSEFQEPFELHIIGLVQDPNLLKKIQQDSRMIYYGYQNSIQYAHILELSDLALGSFGMHLKNLKQASSLKVREYLACGLPVYSGHADYAFEGRNFPYYINGKLDPREIYDTALKFRKVKREVVRNAVFPFIDKQFIFNDIVRRLVDAFGLGRGDEHKAALKNKKVEI